MAREALPVRPSGSLCRMSALLPPDPWRAPHAESGLSKLAALTRRYRHLKYVVAASVVVVLVIVVILLSWRVDSGKAVPSASPASRACPEVPSLGHVEPLPQKQTPVAPGAEPKGRTSARVASKRPAVVHSAGPAVKAAAVGERSLRGTVSVISSCRAARACGDARPIPRLAFRRGEGGFPVATW